MNYIFYILLSKKAIEQLKAWPNLLQQFSPLYSTCKIQIDELSKRFSEMAANDKSKNGVTGKLNNEHLFCIRKYIYIFFKVYSDNTIMIPFMSGFETISSGDTNFTTSVANLINVINGIINDPRTIVKGEQFGILFL